MKYLIGFLLLISFVNNNNARADHCKEPFIFPIKEDLAILLDLNHPISSHVCKKELDKAKTKKELIDLFKFFDYQHIFDGIKRNNQKITDQNKSLLVNGYLLCRKYFKPKDEVIKLNATKFLFCIADRDSLRKHENIKNIIYNDTYKDTERKSNAVYFESFFEEMKAGSQIIEQTLQ